MATKKSWAPDKLMAHIKEVCGKAVADALEPLQKRVTDYGSWIDGVKTGSQVPPAIGRGPTLGPDDQKGLAVGAMIGALALGKGDPEAAIKALQRDKHKSLDPTGATAKALESATLEAGGVFVPEEVSSDFIDLLTPRAVVRSFGTTVLPMTGGNLTVPKLTAASAAYYIGENKDAVKSQQSFGMKKLTARKLAVLVPIANDLLRRGGARVSSVVRNDALRAAALKEDVSFIRAVGTQYTPKGLRYQAASANVIEQSLGGSYTLDSITDDLGSLVLLLEEANVAFSNPGWIFSPRVAMQLMTIRDSNGNYAFRAEMMTGKFWGYPFRKTTQIPRNLGSGENESEVYLADFDDVIIGDAMSLEIAVSTEASYKDENGDSVSAFSLDQTVMRVLLEHDLAVRHDESVAVLTKVVWAPGGGA